MFKYSFKTVKKRRIKVYIFQRQCFKRQILYFLLKQHNIVKTLFADDFYQLNIQ